MFCRTIMLCCFQKTRHWRAIFGYLCTVVLWPPSLCLVASEEKVSKKESKDTAIVAFHTPTFSSNKQKSMYAFCLFDGGEKIWRADTKEQQNSKVPSMDAGLRFGPRTVPRAWGQELYQQPRSPLAMVCVCACTLPIGIWHLFGHRQYIWCIIIF